MQFIQSVVVEYFVFREVKNGFSAEKNCEHKLMRLIRMFARCKLTQNEFDHSGFGRAALTPNVCCNDTQQIAYALV